MRQMPYEILPKTTLAHRRGKIWFVLKSLNNKIFLGTVSFSLCTAVLLIIATAITQMNISVSELRKMYTYLGGQYAEQLLDCTAARPA